MSNLARAVDDRGVFQETGTVARVEAGALVVRTESGDCRARRAVSCLVEPAPGDYVLVAGVPGGGCYVLAVLEREEGAPTRLLAEGDLEVLLPRGRFTVAAQKGVELASAGEVGVVAAGVRVSAAEGSVLVQRLSLLGSVVRAEFAKVKLLAEHCDSVLERVSQRVKRSYRRVEEYDQVRAAQIDYAADKNVSVRGENTLVTARELVKLDGEQIHLG